MASSSHIIGPNFRDRIVKAVGLRLSDALGRDTTDYAEIICGDGVPSGGYGRHSDASLVYIRKDASGVDVVVYVSPDGGTTWNAVESSGLGSDAEISAIAGLTSAANKIIRFTGSGTAELIDCTAAGAALLDDANAAAQLTTLGVSAFAQTILDDVDEATFKATVNLEIGTDVQAYDATLASLAALGTAADRMAYTTGIDTWAETPITAAGRAILDDATAADQRTTLGALAAISVSTGTIVVANGQTTGTASVGAAWNGKPVVACMGEADGTIHVLHAIVAGGTLTVTLSGATSGDRDVHYICADNP